MPEKPPGMSSESFADSLVSKAMRDGEFDRLPGAGKPLRDLDEPYRDDWWLTRFLKREDLSVPCAAIDLRAEVEREMTRILALYHEPAVRRAVEALNDRIAQTNRTVTSGPPTSVAKLDVETMVARWHRHRSTLPQTKAGR
jgi:hypothetical protein